MTLINNTKLLKSLIKQGKINLSVDKLPNQLADKILPVVVVSDDAYNDVVATGTGQNTPTVIYTTPTDRDFYLNPEEAKKYGLIDEIIKPNKKK